MNTTLNAMLENWSRYLNDNSDMNIPAMCRAGGPPTNCVYLDETTGHVLISENGGPLEKVSPFVVVMATGNKYQGPDKRNPLPSKKICLSPTKRHEHDTMVEGMLDFMFEEIDTLQRYFVHPSYQYVRNRCIEMLYLEYGDKLLSIDMKNYKFWDCVIKYITSCLDVITSSSVGR
ncbi:hypothetical protein MKK68_12420 [Methylobacterium sp. E-016]|uniref:hypothetical protein n=1 Tax=Methylobacterium sp. E-016 TaxID=2836556 RepID=UPI001FB93F2E|nr:hypothetical protein [Methylobacterium sp. E-016]MCJ2076450.1 hypothetical protein [Methylobacterium sp. E-016]